MCFWASRGKSPTPSDCHLCGHPPLYYLVGAGIGRIFLAARAFFVTLTLLSFAAFAGFLALGLREIRASHVVTKTNALLVLSALLLAWPSGFLHAGRISNDNLSFFFNMAAFAMAAAFFRAPAPRHLYLGAGCMALAFATKSSAIVLVPVWLILVGLVAIRLPSAKRNRFFLPGLCLLGVLTAGVLFATVRTHTFTFGRNPGLVVENSWVHLFGFDLPPFLAEPFASTWTDKGGRQFFWNMLWKTSLFGEFSMGGAAHAVLATFLSAGLLFLLLFGFVGGLHGRLWKRRELLPHLLFIAFSIAGIYYYRWKWSVSSTNDFRFIYPIVPSLVIWYGAAWNHWREVYGKPASNAGLALAGGFALVSCVFYGTL